MNVGDFVDWKGPKSNTELWHGIIVRDLGHDRFWVTWLMGTTTSDTNKVGRYGVVYSRGYTTEEPKRCLRPCDFHTTGVSPTLHPTTNPWGERHGMSL